MTTFSPFWSWLLWIMSPLMAWLLLRVILPSRVLWRRIALGFWVLSIIPLLMITLTLVSAAARIAMADPAETAPATVTSVPYAEQITAAAVTHGIDPLLLTAVVHAESAFVPTAVSRAGAMGLGQIMPATARACGVADPFDVDQNLDCAARVLRENLEMFGGDLRLALAAYNAGPRAVISCGRCVPVYSETQQYVATVTAYYQSYRSPHPAGSLYQTPVSVSVPTLHGLQGWLGVDISGGCGAPLYNPLGTAVVTYNGLDGYVGPHSSGEQNTMLTLVAGSTELTLLHGIYSAGVGDVVQPGQQIGVEAATGNATGCHSHVILRIDGRTVNYLSLFEK